ncbi:hypothetical protein HNP47_000117 [Brevundimonas vesicularis]|uniref:Uncharacterized protein n=1 Tax=Brevundimonas vesicularis TaxID=41276 RepID=A0A7W9FRD0_BREVE|nr:hypothetical protein [Brevundimonas vesicularis]MBB5770148.1 hypothetical protein [Brevundimonas vesicularis]
MTAKSKRTHPLDRDGDGDPGGSLPGNQTAPMAWTRDDQRLIAKLQLAQVTLDPAFTDAGLADEVAGWSDETAQQVEAFADAMTADGRYQDEAGDERNADGSPIELPPILSRALIGETDQTAGDTFDAEQVAAAKTAGEGAVIAEEGETVADPTTATAPLDDGLVNIPTDTAPVAVRLHELRILVTARRLYKSPEGYSSNYGPPYIDQATVDAWIAAGLAEDVPTAGNMGGVRVTSEGRSALYRAPTDEAA